MAAIPKREPGETEATFQRRLNDWANEVLGRDFSRSVGNGFFSNTFCDPPYSTRPAPSGGLPGRAPEYLRKLRDLTGLSEKEALQWGLGAARQAAEFCAGGGTVVFRSSDGTERTLKVPLPVAPWAAKLGLLRSHGLTEADINAAYRRKAREVHPDVNGGDQTKMVELNAARDEALDDVRQANRRTV